MAKRRNRLRTHKVWIDNKDGTNRLKKVKKPGAPKPPGPRPVPQAVSERSSSPAKFGRYSGKFGRLEAKCLLDRAGFGGTGKDYERLQKMGLQAAVYSLTRPKAAQLVGPAPHDEDGLPIAPQDAWGHDHLWWLDRMRRSNQPLVERMSLIFHDWFATSDDGVGRPDLMIAQSNLFRQHALGSFRQLTHAVTIDPAMLIWLNGIDNHRWAPNENYARELMELFALGADRGAYTEDDIRELARSLTGWRAAWTDSQGFQNFRFDENAHDKGVKTVFGHSGNYDYKDAVDLVLNNPYHASFFVGKLWSYFIPTDPSASTLNKLVSIYKEDYQIRPVLEAILMHPDFYQGERMVKPPVVHLVSLLKLQNRYIETSDWAWLCYGAGQQLYHPPNVSGWDDSRWLDTSTMRARWHFFTYINRDSYIEPWPDDGEYSTDEDATQAVLAALEFWDWPPLTADHRAELLRFSKSCLPVYRQEWEEGPFRAMRQNALRQLIAASPDMLLM